MTSHLFFDLDGTLTDSSPGITRCIIHALEALGAAAPPAAELTWCIGPPLLESFQKLLGDGAQAAQAVTLYRERFASQGLYENAVYDGVAEMLGALGERGYILHVATSKPQPFALRIVEHFDLAPHFANVYGARADGSAGHKPLLLAQALKASGAAAAQSTMIGDRRHDVVGALANQMKVIGVLYGYGSHAELSEAGAAIFANSPNDLLSLL